MKTKETEQIKTLIRQIAQAKTDEFMRTMLEDINSMTSGTVRHQPRTTTKRARTIRARTTRTSGSGAGARLKTGEAATRILNLIKDKPGIKAVELKPAVGATQSAYTLGLRKLKDEGKIRQKGSKKTTTYFPK